jgi:glutamine cyclotransferase
MRILAASWRRLRRKASSYYYWGHFPWYRGLDIYKTGIRIVKPVLVAELPHDPAVFTQGLAVAGDFLYESAGLYGKSSLRRLTLTGELMAEVPAPQVFAEGIAVVGQELVQLTWREQLAIRYELPAMDRIGGWRYVDEGWGLAACADGYIMSNGTGQLVQRDASFAVKQTVPVSLQGRPIFWLNDLEYVAGLVLANVWGANFLLGIDYPAGTVSCIVDCGGLLEREQSSHSSHVMNGLAYCTADKTFFLTGKCWQAIYQVQLPTLFDGNGGPSGLKGGVICAD